MDSDLEAPLAGLIQTPLASMDDAQLEKFVSGIRVARDARAKPPEAPAQTAQQDEDVWAEFNV